jgi:hypothetical protein
VTRVLAIDPGSDMSAYVIIDTDTFRPDTFGKAPNEGLRMALPGFSRAVESVAIEMVASYGMPVGVDVFETCVWIGRFIERCPHPAEVELVYRRDIKLHHCGSSKAKDANITQALIDRFAAGEPNRGKGTTAAPGWFHGFAADIWQAYALAVYVADTRTAS